MRILLLSVLILVLASTNTTSLPNGIGSTSDGGCYCHGASSQAATITVEGIPSNFSSLQTYNISIQINASVERASEDSGRLGGVRVLISAGTIFSEELQYLENGWTHNQTSNMQRVWNLSWQAPQDDDQIVDFTIHANAVNGGGGSNGDYWASSYADSVGINYTGETGKENINSVIEFKHLVVAFIGGAIFAGAMYFVVKD